MMYFNASTQDVRRGTAANLNDSVAAQIFLRTIRKFVIHLPRHPGRPGGGSRQSRTLQDEFVI